MADTYLCAHCGSTYLQALMDSFQCLHCGNLTRMDGTPAPVEPTFGDGPYPDRRPR